MYEDLIAAAAAAHDLRPELLAAVIQKESNWDTNAVGDGGRALGLMQMHRGACQDVGAVWEEMKDPAKSIPAGAAYLKRMLLACGGDTMWALAAWNQGPTVIGRAKRYSEAVLALVPPTPLSTS